MDDLKDLIFTSMHNIVSLNDLVTEFTQRIAHLTLSLVDTKTETKMVKTDTEDLKKEMSKVKEELKKLEESREGKWTEYGDWSECSAECGGGTQNRTRSCTHPGPATGGANCEGDDEQTQTCNMDKCPVNGGWTSWVDWSQCSVPCGGAGTKTRNRTCTNPSVAHGGKECSGTGSETASCDKGTCGNVAQIGTPTMVNIYHSPSTADKAIDGNTDGRWSGGSVAGPRTAGSGGWWALTFPEPMYIDSIDIYGRTSCCEHEIDGSTVSIDDQIVETLYHTGSSLYQLTTIRRVGSRIKIRGHGSASSNKHLVLAEVMVYGTYANS